MRKKGKAILIGSIAAAGTAAWSIPYAYYERGYIAIGGEWLLIIFVFVMVYKLVMRLQSN